MCLVAQFGRRFGLLLFFEADFHMSNKFAIVRQDGKARFKYLLLCAFLSSQHFYHNDKHLFRV